MRKAVYDDMHLLINLEHISYVNQSFNDCISLASYTSLNCHLLGLFCKCPTEKNKEIV